MTARRVWAAAAFAFALAAIVLGVAAAIAHFPDGLTVLACVALTVGAAWYGIRRRGAARVVGLGAAALFAAGAVVLVVLENRVLEDVLVIACVAGALAAAREAFKVHAKLPPAERPGKPVLFYNPLSGGGKAERFHLADEARRRGIEPIELRRGQDLEQLVRGAVNDGADALAMAGGDGSQAIVAMIAAELDLPYACIPAGTRNHFALDLGVDRDDVVGALDAFVNGGERRVDLAEVNGRVFVNNVSLGLYAEAVQHPGYREAKLHTLLEAVPTRSDRMPSLRIWSGGAPTARSPRRRSSFPTMPIASATRSGPARGRGSIGRSSASPCWSRRTRALPARSPANSGCSSG